MQVEVGFPGRLAGLRTCRANLQGGGGGVGEEEGSAREPASIESASPPDPVGRRGTSARALERVRGAVMRQGCAVHGAAAPRRPGPARAQPDLGAAGARMGLSAVTSVIPGLVWCQLGPAAGGRDMPAVWARSGGLLAELGVCVWADWLATQLSQSPISSGSLGVGGGPSSLLEALAGPHPHESSTRSFLLGRRPGLALRYDAFDALTVGITSRRVELGAGRGHPASSTTDP